MTTKGLRYGVRQLADCRGYANVGDHPRFQDFSMKETHLVVLQVVLTAMTKSMVQSSGAYQAALYHFHEGGAIPAPALGCPTAARIRRRKC
jgi:hypothetical protein